MSFHFTGLRKYKHEFLITELLIFKGLNTNKVQLTYSLLANQKKKWKKMMKCLASSCVDSLIRTPALSKIPLTEGSLS